MKAEISKEEIEQFQKNVVVIFEDNSVNREIKIIIPEDGPQIFSKEEKLQMIIDHLTDQIQSWL